MNPTLPSTPDSIIPANALAFYGDSWAEALGRCAYYLNSIEANREITEPMIRMVHYEPYNRPFTVTLIMPIDPVTADK